jgi:hypothetical protein
MATVNKSFRIKNGLIVEGSTGTINGQNILTETGGDSYILNLVGGATLVKSVESTQLEVSGAGKLSVKSNVFDAYGAASAAESAAISAAASDATTKANAAQSAAATDATTKANSAVSTAAADATTKANNARSAAEATAASDATTKANAAQSAAASDATTKANAAQTAAASDATTKANAAVTSANGYTDTAIATEVTNRNSAITSAINTEVSNRNTAIATAVDSLVDGAPALLNTLNELAAAINDDANYSTTLTTALGGKAPLESPTFTGTVTLPNNTITQSMMSDDSVGTNEIGGSAVTTAKIADSAVSTAKIANGAVTSAKIEDSAITSGKIANGTIVNEDISSSAAIALSKLATDPLARANHTGTQAASTISDFSTAALAATSAAYDPAGAAATAQGDAEYTAQTALNAVTDGNTAFAAVNVNDLVSQRAAQAVLSSIATGSSVMSWAKSSYPTAKLWVKFATATHSQISEILLTTDSSNNIAITDFAETGTNGSLGTISASYLSGNIGVEVNTVYANTTVTVVATLIK